MQKKEEASIHPLLPSSQPFRGQGLKRTYQHNPTGSLQNVPFRLPDCEIMRLLYNQHPPLR